MKDYESELEKIKYHQKLLIHVSVNESSKDTLFFQNVVMFDVSEVQVKNIVEFIMKNDLKGLINYLEVEKIDYPVEYILGDCVKQNISKNNAELMLSFFN